MNTARSKGQRQAAIAVIVNEQGLLVIERSKTVRAPGKFCFPGGEVEQGEHIAEAVVREIKEELGLDIQAVRKIWESVAPSGCILNWIHAKLLQPNQTPRPSKSEVASWQWMTTDQLRGHPEVLSSNLEFLDAWQAGQFSLPCSSS